MAQGNRGVAQGAVESPWLYSCYVDGITHELKRRGLGIMFGGTRVPLLMYADDIVMPATQYAYKYRFRHNGDKSAVMAFDADAHLTKRVRESSTRASGPKSYFK